MTAYIWIFLWISAISILTFVLCTLIRQEFVENRLNKKIDDLLKDMPKEESTTTKEHIPTFKVYNQFGKEKNIENIKKVSKHRLVWDKNLQSYVKVIELREEDLV